MYAANARVSSAKASQYLVQLCKHFSHKAPATFDESQGRIDFQPGLCLLAATAHELIVTCEAETIAELDRVKLIVADHIVRFGWRDTIEISWTDRRPSASS